MSSEIATERVAQCHAAAKPDQDGVHSRAQVRRKIADTSPDPGHVQARQAEGEGGQHVDTAIPAMKDWKAVADLRNQLNRSGEHDECGGSNMRDYGSVAHGKAGEVAVGEVPLMVVASQRGESVERRYRKGEDHLAEDGHGKPEARGCPQGSVSCRGQFQPVSHYCGTHNRFSI